MRLLFPSGKEECLFRMPLTVLEPLTTQNRTPFFTVKEVPKKLTCPKCENDSFKLSISERQEVVSQADMTTKKLTVINILNITCAKCGWNKHFVR